MGIMEPTDPGGRPPEPERPTPPRPAWPPPPPAASWPGQPPGSAPPGQQGWAPPPAPQGWPPPRRPPPGWGPRPQGPPGWGMPTRRRAEATSRVVVASVVGLLVLAVVAAVLVARPEVQVGSARGRSASGPRPSSHPTRAPTCRSCWPSGPRPSSTTTGRPSWPPSTSARSLLQGSRRPCSPACGRCRSRPSPTASTAPCVPRSLKRRYDAEQVYQARAEARYQFRGQDASPVLARDSFTFVLTGSGWRIAGPGDRQMRAATTSRSGTAARCGPCAAPAP